MFLIVFNISVNDFVSLGLLNFKIIFIIKKYKFCYDEKKQLGKNLVLMQKKVSKINIYFNTLSIKFMSFELIFNVFISLKIIVKVFISFEQN